MAAPVLVVSPLTAPDVSVSPNLTDLTGGLSDANGYNGSDFSHSRNRQGNDIKKSGNGQIVAVPWTENGTLPTSFLGTNWFRRFTFIDADLLLDGYTPTGTLLTTDTDMFGFGCGTGSVINSGIDYVFDADQNLRKFVWMGGFSDGVFSITASFANSVIPQQSIDLSSPGAYTKTENWFSVSFRAGAVPTTVRIRIRKTASLANTDAAIYIPACYVEPNIKAPYPRAHRAAILHQGLYGAQN